ncbi:rhomboid family intramembrane serine protease [Aquiflexum gelatinilyticum]|uniref:rhomboid family intramembrane serine protease n=1 Tax=Aquiflexum gelatinilyticum TaxID=2961943 RepID=UPI002169CF77|nr:rhomboid family intramembrane serine protease [Aquiflexum gelatinilyticum]MCS4434003.1 rhomboid family intramembrane serine protease [Aquiflexum gelatinilyticum]
MYEGFWYNLKNAFKLQNNSLYKIMAINILVFFVMVFVRVILTFSGAGNIYESFRSLLMMPADIPQLIIQPWSVLTYMFFHEGIFHILFNMLFLYWFGLLLTEYLGSKKLANIYILGGLAGGVLYLVMYNISPYFAESLASARMLGASAGVYAVVVAAATLAPNTTFFLLLLGPVKIKYIAIFYVLIAFVNSTGNNAGGELAHLGGAALGFLYVYQLQKGRDIGSWIQAIGNFFKGIFSRKSSVKVTYRKSKTYSSGQDYTKTSTTKSSGTKVEVATQEEIDLILDKIAAKGYEALSKEEKRKLFEFSKK